MGTAGGRGWEMGVEENFGRLGSFAGWGWDDSVFGGFTASGVGA